MSMKKIKVQFLVAVLSVCFSFMTIVTATYAWYVSNNSVTTTTNSISATTNGFILQIANLEQGAQHGGNQTSLAATSVGGKITPSSTNDLNTWYICEGWGPDGKVITYTQPPLKNIDGKITGEYDLRGETHFAFIKSEYIVYTINESGFADVYLDAFDGKPILVQVDNGEEPTSDTVPNSLRIAITTQNVDTDGKTGIGPETLKVVYSPSEVTGSGNDSAAIPDKWTYINGTAPEIVTYNHIDSTNYNDQNDYNWVVKKDGENYVFPAGRTKETSKAIAEHVGYNGVLLRVYIWMEGTDADCVNNEAAEDEATYSVTVKLAGIAS